MKEEILKDKPMGVSQWKKHGKKYGYWKFFEDKAEKKGREEVIGNMYEFARQRMDDSDRFSNSLRDKWKATGVRELLADLFRYLKELKPKNE